MESELSGIFRVKLVTKNIVRGFPGIQFMHMRVKRVPRKNVDFHFIVLVCAYFFHKKFIKLYSFFFNKVISNLNISYQTLSPFNKSLLLVFSFGKGREMQI